MRSRLTRLLRIASPREVFPTRFANDPQFREETGFTDAEAIGHDPELTARDDAVFLLHTAAEVEHALMVQYLYAAYSLDETKVPDDKKQIVRDWRKTLLEIAREEMGHLASVQNLLHLIGGALNIEREDFPFRNILYPFRFKLEPLTKNSLAKYVFAEMPPGLEGAGIEEIKKRANTANEANPVNHVGLLYAAIANIFKRKNLDGSFALTDLLENTVGLQADESWKFTSPTLIVRSVKTRDEAIVLIDDIAKQGEGNVDEPDSTDSHYHKLRKIYDAFPDGEWQPAVKLPADPNTTLPPEQDSNGTDEFAEGRITDPKTRLWAQLLNLRYRRLLVSILHALHLDNTKSPDRENRFLQIGWIFVEMRTNIKSIAAHLASPPPNSDGAFTPSGAPFELPYSLSLPADETNRWRLHRDIIIASKMLTERLLSDPVPSVAQKTFLTGLGNRDSTDLNQILAKITTPPQAGGNSPANPINNPPVNSGNRFSEIIEILENSVADSQIGAHGNFWLNKTRDEFIAARIFGQALIAKKADGTFGENESNLVKALQGRIPFGSDTGTPAATFRQMPAGMDAVPQEKIAIIQQWIKDGCPDD